VSTAAVCTELVGEGGIELREWPEAPLGKDAVRIEVRAASVNYPDVLMVRGLYQAKLEPPFVAGTECSGRGDQRGRISRDGILGGGSSALGLGSGAFSTGSTATPPFQQVHRIPDEMTFAHAAAFNITYGTGIHGLLRRGGLQAGESVLVLGAAGGCGSAAVQIAKAAGAFVVAVAGGAQKCELARELGADVVIDHQRCESLSTAVKDATAGRGVDIVFDTVGGPDAREQMRCLAWNGRYVVIGFASGEIPVVKVNQTILKGISIVGVAYGLSAIADPKANAQDFAQLFDWYRQGLVTPAIGDAFPLVDTTAALRVVFERRALGKVIIEMPA
jgi:NADPH2:quinone reductase